MTTTEKRRVGDQTFHWLLAARVDGEEAAPPALCSSKLELFAYSPGEPDHPQPVTEWHERIGSRPAMLLLDIGAEDALLISGAGIRKLPRNGGGSDLFERASEGAHAWARFRQHTSLRLELPERLVAFADALADVRQPSDVLEALVQHTAGIVGGYSAVLLLRERQPASGEKRLVHPEGVVPPIPHYSTFRRPGTIVPEEAQAHTGAPLAGLAEYFRETGAVMLAHVPFGDEGVLFVSERRRDRVFEAEHWDLFRSLCRQADCALARVRSLDEVKRLSLTDPLTGIGNRRRLEVAMESAWAGARRGEPLSVLMIDLDQFKRVNDAHGHSAGDRVLKQVGTVLKEEARGSDIAVRYGGDEFLVVLRGTGASGAYMLSRRLTERLQSVVGITVGFAEYHHTFSSPEELIEAADRHLYQLKRESGQEK